MHTVRDIPDLLLDGGERPAPTVERLGLIDAPKLEHEPQRTGFDWKPVLIIVAVVLTMMLAVAVL